MHLPVDVCGDQEFYLPLIIWITTFQTILVDLEHQTRLEWRLDLIFVFLQTVMVQNDTAINSNAPFLTKMI